MNIWITQHLQAMKQVLHRSSINAMHTFLISLVIGVTLALPVLGYVAINNLGDLTGKADKEAQISIFLRQDASEAAKSALRQLLEGNPAIKSMEFVSKEKALEQLEDSFADATLIESLQHNPLPDAFQIIPQTLEMDQLRTLQTELESMEGVQEVVLDTDWLNRLNSFILLAKQILWLITGLFALLLVTVISNTVRMQIMAQREEIEVSQLIGATAAFTRRPFLYLGGLYGLFGGILAIIIAAVVVYIFNQSIAPLTAAYQTNFSLNYPTLKVLVATCAVASVIGLLSAYFTASKFINKSMR
ncbi:MAG TPA: permease-like cell division protein FtsX [Methylophilus sp.]|nr:permease-like cell division protein FtsX [Methylophilus sp.]HQQ32883.1 permease-like cell division protein FtsX [Methylophilus sp.]